MGKDGLDFKVVEIPQPIFADPTNVFRIGQTLIDTCHADDASVSVLVEQLDRGDLRGIKEVIVTHPHVDHVTASAALPRLAEMPHTVFSGAENILRDLYGYLSGAQRQQEGVLVGGDEGMRQLVRAVAAKYWPTDRQYLDINISRIVKDGEEIEADGTVLKAVYTPGHEANHMSLFHEPSGTLFSGDLVANNAHFVVAPLTPDIGQYERSLHKVLALNPRLIVPSHGKQIPDAVEHLQKCLANVQTMKIRIVDIVRSHGSAPLPLILEELFGDVDPMRYRVMSVGTACYLQCLHEEGMIVFDREALVASLQ